jgi:hypothetical protein
MSSDFFAGYGSEPGDIYDLAKKWGMTPERLTFLANCPQGIHRKFLKEEAAWSTEEKRLATQCRHAHRQGFTAYEAAEYAKVELGVVTAFLAKVGVTWPGGCRRKLSWGGSLPAGKRSDYGTAPKGPVGGANLFKTRDGRTLRIKEPASYEAAQKAHDLGITLREAEKRFGISYTRLYIAAKKMGLKIARKYKPRGPNKVRIKR